MGLNDKLWLDDPKDWRRLAKAIRKAGICGLDTEFYNCNPSKESPVGKATVHVWSVAIRSGEASPLGHLRAVGWVLPASALEDPNLRGVLEDASITKCVHNQPADDHTLHNHGIALKGCINTLNLARWKWPELVREGGFGLKNLMEKRLRRPIVCEFDDVVSYMRDEEVVKVKRVTVKRCECGVEGCRLRKARGIDSHDKFEVEEEHTTVTVKTVEDKYPLESILPGHPRWELLLDYAVEDAIAALEVEELAQKEEDPAPWPPWPSRTESPRPAFPRAVDDEVVKMERVGFPVDVAWCQKQLAEKVAPDEEAALEWLWRWYEKNNPYPGVAKREPTINKKGKPKKDGVDNLWSSPKRLVKMLDLLDVPRSPIWKKGRVKPGEVKTDEVAMGWIAEAMPEMASFVKHFIHLKRIRSGKKYLSKMAASGGHVHTICGPAGDADDAVGAITGRLGIKGVLEAQQLPKPEDKPERDLYLVRRAIVANLSGECS